MLGFALTFEHEPLLVAVCHPTGERITAVISIKQRSWVKLVSIKGE